MSTKPEDYHCASKPWPDMFASVARLHNPLIHTWTIFEVLQAALIFTLLSWYLQFLWQRRKLYIYSYNLPGPLALPLVGSALHFIENPYDLFSTIMKMYNEYPKIFRIWFGPRLFYAVADPKYYEILLRTCLRKDEWYVFAETVIGQGIFTAPSVKKWKRNRKIIKPTFNQKILDGFVEVFSEQSQVAVEQLKKVAGKGEFDIFDALSKYSVNLICETAMGVKVEAETTDNDNMSLSRCIERLMDIAFMRTILVWYHSDFIFSLSSMSKEFSKCLKRLYEFTGTVVREKKLLFEEAKKLDVDARQTFWEEGFKRKAFLDYLLQMTSEGNSFTEEELKDEVNTFIVAGSDTTASTSSFVFVSLGLHKDLQERVYEEIIEVVGPDRPVEQRDLPRLKYMERVIKETLRIFPPGGFVIRAVDEDVNLGDHVLPAGVSVILGILKTHTDEKYWPDPYKFDPDRFLPEEVAKRHPCAYLPFLYGPRNCIGGKYAMMAMKTLLATALREFKVSTSYKNVQDVQLKTNLVLKPINGYKVSLELR